MKKFKPEIRIVPTTKGFTLFVDTMVCRLYSKRGYLKAVEDARMITYALNASGIEWRTDIDLSPY